MTGKTTNLHEYRFFSPKSLSMVIAYRKTQWEKR